MVYDIEANILSIELSKSPISHAVELGNFIVHLSKGGQPVLIEILNASKFTGQLDKIKLGKMENIKQASIQNATSTKQTESTIKSVQEVGLKLQDLVKQFNVK